MSDQASSPSLVTTALLTVAIVFPILATLAVALRIWSTLTRTKKLFVDDYVILLALLFAWGVPIDVYVAAGLGGVGNSSLSALDASRVFLRALWIEIFPLITSLVLVKVSILLFYQRIFVTPWFQLAVRIYIAILVMWGIACLIAQLLAGNPVTAAFNPLAINPLRYNYNNFSIAFTGMSIGFDVIVLCFPLPVVHRLVMSTRRKMQLVGIFWLGIFCCIASILRFYYVYTEVYASTASTGANRYVVVTPGVIWGTIEPSTSVIAACLPTYGHLIGVGKGLLTRVRSFWSRTSLHSTGGRDHTHGSTANSTKVLSSKNLSNKSYPTTGGLHWHRLKHSKGGNTDIEMGDTSFEDDIPLKTDAQPMRIHVSQDFTQQELPASTSDITTRGKPMGQPNMF
ncbi:uncharacterized protein N7484_010240 [Penicillium longicatenatum]|uniref:uncharacterized protein n=1 Tax=Penicillium longicatenatum TaxID=1561947 RepID=UPI002549B26B|nr:uncharacterized protein N7484_010240 [Penicillium longicatenatum]KAJ5636927.1 hypothetical protein N7484_010240 [Penicillium longicatenatum]